MPIYEYQAVTPKHSCPRCKDGFEILQHISDTSLTKCNVCGNKVKKLISAPRVGASQSNFDDRAKASGFHKLKKLGKGEYEKQY